MRVVNDRRTSPRVTVRGDAFVHTTHGVVCCRCIDLSVGGMSVLSPKSARPRHRALIETSFGGHSFNLPAVVVRRKRTRDGYMLGLRFGRLDERLHAKLDDVLRTMQVQSALAQQASTFSDRLPRLELPERNRVPAPATMPMYEAEHAAPAHYAGYQDSSPHPAAPAHYAGYRDSAPHPAAPAHYAGYRDSSPHPAAPAHYAGYQDSAPHPAAPAHYAAPPAAPDHWDRTMVTTIPPVAATSAPAAGAPLHVETESSGNDAPPTTDLAHPFVPFGDDDGWTDDELETGVYQLEKPSEPTLDTAVAGYPVPQINELDSQMPLIGGRKPSSWDGAEAPRVDDSGTPRMARNDEHWPVTEPTSEADNERLPLDAVPQFVPAGDTEVVLIEPEPSTISFDEEDDEPAISGLTMVMNLDDLLVTEQPATGIPQGPVRTGSTLSIDLGELWTQTDEPMLAETQATGWSVHEVPMVRFGTAATEVELEEVETEPEASVHADDAKQRLRLPSDLQVALSRLRRRSTPATHEPETKPPAHPPRSRRRRRPVTLEGLRDAPQSDAPEVVALYREALDYLDSQKAPGRP